MHTWILILYSFFIFFLFQGGRSAAYKNSVLQKSNRTEGYQKDGAALFRVQGLRHDCARAVQVDLVSLGKNPK
jgi:advillin